MSLNCQVQRLENHHIIRKYHLIVKKSCFLRNIKEPKKCQIIGLLSKTVGFFIFFDNVLIVFDISVEMLVLWKGY